MMFQVSPSILPPDEDRRMQAVRYNVLDTPPDGAFDRVSAIAARRFYVPISIISIVDHDRTDSISSWPSGNTDHRELGLCAAPIFHRLRMNGIMPRKRQRPLMKRAGHCGESIPTRPRCRGFAAQER
jgi:hypothetical protein